LFVDSRTLDDGTVVESEVCIIGGGAAGIALARELAHQPFRVALIESGDIDYDDETHELLEVVNTGRPYGSLPHTRLRFFGGTTNHWGGHCAPINPIVFEERPWIPNSGWPISRQDLDPYYQRAHAVMELGPMDYDAQRTATDMGMVLFPFDPVRTYLWGNVTNINRDSANPVVTDVSVRTLSGKNYTVSARFFVLATGGIENARMLLLSRDVETRGLGNGNDLVGRYFMEHISYRSGIIFQSGAEDLLEFYSAEHDHGDVAVRGHISLPDKLIRELEIPMFRTEIEIVGSSILNTEASWSIRDLRESVAEQEWPEDLGHHLMNILSGLDDIVFFSDDKARFPAAYFLDNYVEQTPNPDSRIELAAEKDRLGLNLAAVNWRLSELDKAGIRKAHDVIAEEVGRSGFGRMRKELPEQENLLLAGADGGAHHMGTTRMHDDPRLGVVDADCRIHGLGNMYVAGSSVFPCAGYINPTLTIVALAIRLGDHLKARMGGSEESS
jgi:choline dehydrogenase-like flavoprotein